MKPASDRARVLVLGYLVRGPMGGMAWHHLQYLMGLLDLGHDAWFLEDSGDTEYCCYDPSRNITDRDPSYGLKFAADTFGRIGARERWAYHDAHTGRWHGPAAGEIREIARDADLLINLSCSNPIRPWLENVPLRLLVDTDPLFTQIRHLTNPARRELAAMHNRFFTFAGNIGDPDCLIPDDGFPWLPTRQPIVLDAWRSGPPPVDSAFTTVMQWDSYDEVRHEGQSYGMKSRTFADFMDLPTRCAAAFEPAIGGPGAPRAQLREMGWKLRNPNEVAASPQDYQDFIASSLGEFTVAKHGYVESRSGWFSERSAAYLASGRPVVTQETGFSRWLPTGEGLIAFNTPDEAQAACDGIFHHRDTHVVAAREIAGQYFDSKNVLASLLGQAVC